MNEPTENAKPETYIAHYKLGKIIGRGGMGLVYLAEDTRLNRRVAIKCLRTELFEPHYRERFRREALLLAKLNHPHIVHIYDYIESDDQMALVMEYIDGQNLQSLLREQIVPIHQRMRWLVQIAQGLAVAHEAGIIHRDLKQENILINKQGMAKISDLGIAKSQDFNATLTDHVAGSYCSMSPEQAMGEAVDFKSDLFSFGILAYQLLCGTHPFGDTDNKLQIMQRIISHPPIAPSKSNPDLPPEIGQLLGQLLSKNPERRPDSTLWVAAHLETLCDLLAEDTPVDDTVAMGTQGKMQGTQGRATRARMTRDHATFETRYENRRYGDQSPALIREHWVLLAFVLALVITVAGVSIWQMQPKQPKYVAVTPPVITAEEMDESQQAIIKSVVHDALEQGALQLEGYFLIPHDQIAALGGDTEQIGRASAADEVLASQIQCKARLCNLRLSRLQAAKGKTDAPLQVKDTRTFDVLIDDLQSVAEFTQNNFGILYAENMANGFSGISDKDYGIYIQTYAKFENGGANFQILEELEQISSSAKLLPAVKSLYLRIILDLYFEHGDQQLLDQYEKVLNSSRDKSQISYLYHRHAYESAKGDIISALETIRQIEKLKPDPAEIYRLQGYSFLGNNSYDEAIEQYTRSDRLRSTAANKYAIALANWYRGDYLQAKAFIDQALAISPSLHKAIRLKGALALMQGDPQTAADAFAAIDRGDDIAVISNLGVSLLLLKEYKQAAEQFERARKIAPGNTTIRLNLADALALSGEYDLAKPLYSGITEEVSNQKTADLLRNKAQANAHLGNHAKAIKHLQELQRIDALSVETIYTSAIVYTLANEHLSSLINIENALTHGMNPVWFSFPWFDRLCSNEAFPSLMETYGVTNRCAP
jgi:tetratricopeptide (TPR) repeat protein/predicted Ser/Thr protein kinase